MSVSDHNLESLEDVERVAAIATAAALLLDVRVEDVPEPRILNPRDAIVRITSTAISRSS